jgi:hypothetical protein
MNTRIHLAVILTTTCGVAATAIIGLAVWRAAPERTAAPAHGEFAARLQPVLEGIGSTRELTPVPLGAAASEPERAASAGGVPPAEHRHHERRRRPQ